MFKACDLHRNLFAQALPDEDLASLLVNEENLSKVHPKLLTDEIPSQVISKLWWFMITLSTGLNNH